MSDRRTRLEPRLVITCVLVAIPVLWVIGQVILTKATESCGEPDHSQVGDLVQMFVPGDACVEEPAPTRAP
ncbi:MAG TPA: hypothetical protein VLA97_09630 [Nocardioidaceae bacterium]|jgi:hypothetical protein|nr:hypothetical protein [Nocardioidaceae bacterium]